MTWRRQRTSIDVDIDDFTPEQMLQGLIDEGYLSSGEAAEIVSRHEAKGGSKPLSFATAPDEAALAEEYLLRGMRGEALLHLERALGRYWRGVLQ